MIHETIYKKLLRIVPELADPKFEAKKLKSEGFMDLNIDILSWDAAKDKCHIALSHYYKHDSGDMIPDPDMEVALYPSRQMAEALSYQDCFGYRQVYPEPGKINPRAKKELNSFLNQWLSNIIAQGHR
jgi:uncharacterized protein YqiB (DUF1249 family)